MFGLFLFLLIILSNEERFSSKLVLPRLVSQTHRLGCKDLVLLLLAFGFSSSAFLEHFQRIFDLVLEDFVMVVMRGHAALIIAHIEKLLRS